MMKLATAGLLIIENRKLLLAFSRNKQCFYLPGGKLDPGESAQEAVCREIAEELNVIIDKEELEYYTHISAPAFGENQGIIMEQDCFLLHRKVLVSASAEIGAVKFFSLNEYLNEPTRAPGAVMVLEQLWSEGLID